MIIYTKYGSDADRLSLAKKEVEDLIERDIDYCGASVEWDTDEWTWIDPQGFDECEATRLLGIVQGILDGSTDRERELFDAHKADREADLRKYAEEEEELFSRRTHVYQKVSGTGDAYGNGAKFRDNGSDEIV